MSGPDLIAAGATPPGTGAIGIVRLSGEGAFTVAKWIAGSLPPVRMAQVRTFRDAQNREIDCGLVLCFVAPHSYTGEDLVEFQGHGSPVATEALLQALQDRGARLARPGEFSERAFLNGRLDLAQAEAVADLINAESQAAARAALQSLSGTFSGEVRHLGARIQSLRIQAEAQIDFGDDLAASIPSATASALQELEWDLAMLINRGQAGLALRRGWALVLAGPVNAGKSTLFNRFIGESRAIVTPLPGTTRDLLEADCIWEGIRLHVIDSAGFRESRDLVEQEGMRRAVTAVERAHLVLYVIDDTVGEVPEDGVRQKEWERTRQVWRIRNQIDRSGRKPGRVDAQTFALSAETGAGVAELQSAILEEVRSATDVSSDLVLARPRHLDALSLCRQEIIGAHAALEQNEPFEIMAEGVRRAQVALGQILDPPATEELLGAIFSTFCIGK
jgi:tRNA modification GTPase